MTTFAAFALLPLLAAVPVLAARFGLGSMNLLVVKGYEPGPQTGTDHGEAP